MKDFLHNKYVLYAVFMVALIDFLYLGYMDDMNSIYVFILMVILLTFFNKNMIIVLGLTLFVTNILKFNNIHILKEGFDDSAEGDKTEGEDDDGSDDKKEDEADKKEDDDDDVKPESEGQGQGQAVKPEDYQNKNPTKKPTKIPTKEEFGQDKEVVYTSAEDQNIDEDEKMLLAHEKILDRMNKYKPLLDTLQGLTKNIAMVRGITDSVSELKDVPFTK